MPYILSIYNNPNMVKGRVRQRYPIGPQQVRIELPEGAKISRVQALRAEATLPHKQTGRRLEFVIPS